MERRTTRPRAGWRERVEGLGLIWHTAPDGLPYWDESAYYSFTRAEIDGLEHAARELYGLFVAAGEEIAKDPEVLDVFGIPEYCHKPIRDAWNGEPPALNYGRMDLGYNGSGDPKLFEFNCDTPTSMLEAGVIQWDWREAVHPRLDQFTSLHEKLIGKWADIRSHLPGGEIWFAHTADKTSEDTLTTTYMRDLAEQAGLRTHGVVIDDIGLDHRGRFVDRANQPMSAVFKLYPWEWLVNEAYGPDLIRNLPDTVWIEPIWKMIWSNKAVLQVLWAMNPGHPNLLAASVRREAVGDSHVAKPFLSREGSNVRVVRDGVELARTDGAYAEGLTLYQELYPLRNFGAGYPVLGVWLVDGEPAGLGIREDGLITGDGARFLPHVIEG